VRLSERGKKVHFQPKYDTHHVPEIQSYNDEKSASSGTCDLQNRVAKDQEQKWQLPSLSSAEHP
jgi:hypothetical protein